ncbi:MAG: hypothetical protein J0I57_08310 [Hyphomicrobium sp.]|nr:hypothetical protein [Hyphomicrobium sp.]
MPTSAEMILQELMRAFPATRQRAFAALVNTTRGHEPMAVAQAFRDKADWTTLDPDWLDAVPDGLSTALSFLSDEAVCFYIPAFLSADLNGRLGGADPVFALTYGFAHGVGEERIHPRQPRTWGDYARARWSALTRPQARAIVMYLEWRVVSRATPLEREAIAEALAKYWHARAADAS